jgi:hypothetical protein
MVFMDILSALCRPCSNIIINHRFIFFISPLPTDYRIVLKLSLSLSNKKIQTKQNKSKIKLN